MQTYNTIHILINPLHQHVVAASAPKKYDNKDAGWAADVRWRRRCNNWVKIKLGGAFFRRFYYDLRYLLYVWYSLASNLAFLTTKSTCLHRFNIVERCYATVCCVRLSITKCYREQMVRSAKRGIHVHVDKVSAIVNFQPNRQRSLPSNSRSNLQILPFFNCFITA